METPRSRFQKVIHFMKELHIFCQDNNNKTDLTLQLFLRKYEYLRIKFNKNKFIKTFP